MGADARRLQLSLKPVRLPQPGIETLAGPEAVDPERVSIHRVVHPDAAEGGEPQSPEPWVVRELLDPVARAWSERLEKKTPDSVEELLSDLGRELGELPLRLLVGDVTGWHLSPSASPEPLMDAF